MPAAAFEPAIPACERPQIHALGCAATGIGFLNIRGDYLDDSGVYKAGYSEGSFPRVHEGDIPNRNKYNETLN
jgi:hypothetical protein